MERKLRYLEKEIKKDGIPTIDSGELVEAPQPREMIDLEVKKDLFYMILIFCMQQNLRKQFYFCFRPPLKN